jgi:D-glycero-D-manno-heptose 1,7-bisphosphate phosphatase
MSARHNQPPRLEGKQRSEVPPADSRLPAVFLDRDGTIIEEVGYLNHIDRVRLYPWSAKAIRKLNQAGLPVIVMTNQSGVARGYFPEELVRRVHQKIARELAARGARVDAFYYCPHYPNGPVKAYGQACHCRKPETGMIDEAAKRFKINVSASFVVGDSYRDMRMGFRAGARTVLVMTGYGRGEYAYHRQRWLRKPDQIAENLQDAAEKILKQLAR